MKYLLGRYNSVSSGGSEEEAEAVARADLCRAAEVVVVVESTFSSTTEEEWGESTSFGPAVIEELNSFEAEEAEEGEAEVARRANHRLGFGGSRSSFPSSSLPWASPD